MPISSVWSSCRWIGGTRSYAQDFSFEVVSLSQNVAGRQFLVRRVGLLVCLSKGVEARV